MTSNQPSFCGHPNFQLACLEDRLSIQIGGKRYHVMRQIAYEGRVLQVRDFDLLRSDSCPEKISNIFFDFSLFTYPPDGNQDTNLTMFLNCHDPLPDPFMDFLFSTQCSNGFFGQYSHFTFQSFGQKLPMHDLLANCATSVLLPVSNLNFSPETFCNGSMNFSQALKFGFSLTWTTSGICGSNPSDPKVNTYFCPSGTMSKNYSCTTSTPLGTEYGAVRNRFTPRFSQNSGADLHNRSITKLHCSCNCVVEISELVPTPSHVVACPCIKIPSVICLFYICFFSFVEVCCLHGRTSEDQTIETFLQKHGALSPKRYSYLEVKKMTKSFHHKLGEGGFGSVFKGNLSDGYAVAVKLLNNTRGNGEEFLNEVASIGRTSHINVVSLLGFCFQGPKRALMYDFMPNGSLDKYIYAEDPKIMLWWGKLFQIAIGIARGLEYLHRGCNTRIVHFDIKPHNILLDEDFCPKISYFGLAKFGTHKESIILSMAETRGTIGFIAPEVFSRSFGVVSSKSDVYSYGMMVLEMVGGRKNLKASADRTSEIYFPHWIYEHKDQDGYLQQYGMILVGLWCIQTRPEDRPSMNEVVEMLEGSIDELQMPPKPYLSSPT
ncbi:Glycerophosphodiester phosphodiesterase protein, partial [Dioscorea alata]